MASMLEHCEWAYYQAKRLDARQDQYQFGGGHPTPHLPWVKIDPITGNIEPADGPDCSGSISNILWHAGILGTPASKSSPVALSTRELAHWGALGKGKYLTVWVKNTASIEHAVLEFTLLNASHRWFAAAHTHTIVGWQNYGDWNPASVEYQPRHPLLT